MNNFVGCWRKPQAGAFGLIFEGAGAHRDQPLEVAEIARRCSGNCLFDAVIARDEGGVFRPQCHPKRASLASWPRRSWTTFGISGLSASCSMRTSSPMRARIGSTPISAPAP